MIPLVAIIGRPNVGKSALFNRLVGERHAIVSEVYGTTRDALSTVIEVKKKEIELIDTAGIMSLYDHKDLLLQPVQEQAKEVMEQADMILFLADGTAQLTNDDIALANTLRKANKPVVLIITKCDNDKVEQGQAEIYKLGFKNPVFISSLHNRGIDELLERLIKELKKLGFFKREANKKKTGVPEVSFCLVGKPNVGKSSLFNQLVQKSKAVVSDIPGTTRDTIDSEIKYGDMIFKAIDTAGLKRPGKIEKGIEKYSTLRSMRAIKRSDVCLFVIDGTEKISNMDQAVSRYILDEQKSIVIIINKWDLLEDEKDMMDRFLTYLQDKLDYIPWAPVLFVSAKTGENITSILDQVYHVYQERQKRIETGKLNRFVDEVTHKHPPSGTKKIAPKIFYATQVDVNPPQFILFVNTADAFHFSWRRYFENQLREKFGFDGTPLSIEYRNRTREDRSRK
jgi:GTP-binding protein